MSFIYTGDGHEYAIQVPPSMNTLSWGDSLGKVGPSTSPEDSVESQNTQPYIQWNHRWLRRLIQLPCKYSYGIFYGAIPKTHNIRNTSVCATASGSLRKCEQVLADRALSNSQSYSSQWAHAWRREGVVFLCIDGYPLSYTHYTNSGRCKYPFPMKSSLCHHRSHRHSPSSRSPVRQRSHYPPTW